MKIARLDTLPRLDSLFEGGETDAHYLSRQLLVVADDYDFVGNSATDLTDTDSNAIDAFYQYGEALVGRFDGFKDWMCLRNQVKLHVENIAGTDYANFGLLTADQKKAALIYVPTKVIDKQGATFYGTECATAGLNAGDLIKNYLGGAADARAKRYEELVSYAYQQLSTGDGLKAEDEVRANSLKGKFIERGVATTAVDGVDGIDDWIQGINSFTATGLKAKIDASELSLINPALTSAQFCDQCSAIINDGQY